MANTEGDLRELVVVLNKYNGARAMRADVSDHEHIVVTEHIGGGPPRIVNTRSKHLSNPGWEALDALSTMSVNIGLHEDIVTDMRILISAAQMNRIQMQMEIERLKQIKG